MKVLCVAMIAIFGVCYSIMQACESHEWRGHRIVCCTNGTAIESKIGEKVWVAQKPGICGFSVTTKKSDTNWPKVLIFMLITVASICCCWWKFPFQKVRQILQCCYKTEAAEENQIQVKEVEMKVAKKLPKSQSF